MPRNVANMATLQAPASELLVYKTLRGCQGHLNVTRLSLLKNAALFLPFMFSAGNWVDQRPVTNVDDADRVQVRIVT